MLPRELSIRITALAPHPGVPCPPGCSPFAIEVVDESADVHAFTGMFAPPGVFAFPRPGLEWECDESARNLLAMAMVGAEDQEVAALAHDAWAAGERVAVVLVGAFGEVEAEWPVEGASLWDRSQRGLAILDAAAIGASLPAPASRPVPPRM